MGQASGWLGAGDAQVHGAGGTGQASGWHGAGDAQVLRALVVGPMSSARCSPHPWLPCLHTQPPHVTHPCR